MATSIISSSELLDAGEASAWEERIFQEACAWAREKAEGMLQRWDDRLLAEKPDGWQGVGFRERVVMTRFGEVQVRRRLYKDEDGHGRFLLDEHLGLPPRQLATPAIAEKAVEVATEIGFVKTGELFESLTEGVLSAMSIWRLLQDTGARRLAEERAEGKAVYEEGQSPRESGQRIVERLFIEGDGVWVRLQREGKAWAEIKVGIAYEGWEPLAEARAGYALVGKRIYVHGVENLSFWEGASLSWSHHWDLSRIGEIVLGGDGADWIQRGSAHFAASIWQLDGFHLARACRRAVGRDFGRLLFQAIREGRWEEAAQLWQEAPKRKKSTARRAQRWVETCLIRRQGADWRIERGEESVTLRGLGAMEGNNAHFIAQRMKGKGRSWSLRGALHMAKVRELVQNRTFHTWYRTPKPPPASPEEHMLKSTKRKPRDVASWLRVQVPILHSADSQQDWVRNLRRHINGHLLN